MSNRYKSLLMENLLAWLPWLSSAVSGAVCWFAGRYGRKSDSLSKMQYTIDQLVIKNAELVEKVTELREDNAELKEGQAALRRENALLREQIEELKNK